MLYDKKELITHIESQIDTLTALFIDFQLELTASCEQEFIDSIDIIEQIRAKYKKNIEKILQEGKIYVLNYIINNKQ
ncbi:MAG: hypothetical protein LBO66_14190 [Deltaproteobacteria bacterium]|jgi:hypothetical protein|nr:hypothetical protein [Deltaproteobacteria bacterium]